MYHLLNSKLPKCPSRRLAQWLCHLMGGEVSSLCLLHWRNCCQYFMNFKTYKCLYSYAALSFPFNFQLQILPGGLSRYYVSGERRQHYSQVHTEVGEASSFLLGKLTSALGVEHNHLHAFLVRAMQMGPFVHCLHCVGHLHGFFLSQGESGRPGRTGERGLPGPPVSHPHPLS